MALQFEAAFVWGGGGGGHWPWAQARTFAFCPCPREFRLHRLSLDNHIDDYLLKCRELKQHDLTAKFVKVKEDIKNIG